MLEGIVRHQKKFLLILAALLIIVWLLSPTLWGLFDRIKRPRYAGEIFGKRISVREFLETRAKMTALSQRGDKVTPAQVWDRLIQLTTAEKMGIEASDQEIQEYVRNLLKSIYGENAPLTESYGNLLKRFNMTAPQFESVVRENLILSKLRFFVSGAIKVTSREVWQDYKRDNDAFKVHYIEVPFKNFVDEVEQPSEEDIELYWRENKEEFRVPEKIKVGYYAARALDFEEKADVTDEMIKDYYETHKEQYKLEPPSGEKEKPAGDETPEKDPEKGQNKQKDESAGKNAGPENKEPPYKPLDEVRAEIEKTLRKDKAGRLAYDELYDFIIEIEERGRNPEEAIKEHPAIRFEQTDYFSKAEAARLKDVGTARCGDRSFERIVFELEEGVLSDIASNPEGHFAFKLLDRKPSYIQELESVRDKIVERLKDLEVNKKALAKARRLLKKLQAPEMSEEELLKSEKGLKAATTGKFYKRTDISTPFPPGVLDFELNKWDGPLPKRDAYYLAKLVEKKDALRSDFEEVKEKRAQTLLWQKRFSFIYMGQWQRDMQARADIVDHTEELFTK